jgi:ParB family chromosome partitioning protein
MNKSTSRLGKGLSALIGPPRETRSVEHSPARAPSIADGALARMVPIDQIAPNPRQPRTTFDPETLDELARSIRANGVLQPVLLRTRPDGKFELVAGERRWRAARLAELQAIPAIVRDLSDAETLEIALIENLQREDLGPIERATAYQHYITAFSVTVEQLAGRLAESRANIANYLRLLRLAPEIRGLIESGELGMGQARAIAGVGDAARQLALAKLAVRRNLSVRQVETLAKNAQEETLHVSEAQTPPATSGVSRHLADVEQRLAKSLGLRVSLRPGKRKNSGKVVIAYDSLDEFDLLTTRLGAPPAQD